MARGSRGYGWAGDERIRGPWAPDWLRRDVQPTRTHGERTIGELRLLAAGEINRLLLGQELDYEAHELAWTVYQPDHELYPEQEEYAVTVQATAAALGYADVLMGDGSTRRVSSGGYARRQAVRRIVAELLRPLLAFAGEDTGTPAHWVGMRRCGDWAYRIRGGRAVGYQPAAEISEPDPGADEGVPGSAAAETLTNMLPDGYVALAPDVVAGHRELRGPELTLDITAAAELRLVQTRDVGYARELLAGAPAPEPEWERELLAAQP